MRVLWLCSTPAMGSERLGAPAALGGGWTAALEAALAERGGIELCVAFPWDVVRPRRIDAGPQAYIPFPRYPRGGRLRRLAVDLSCRLEPAAEVGHLERAVELARPDLIHAWGTEGFYGLVAERTGLPVLIEIQGPRTPYAQAYLAGLSKLDLLRFGSPRRLLSGRSLLHRYYRYRRSAGRERRILARARYVSGRTAWDRGVCAALAPAARYFHCDRVLRSPFYRARWSRRSPGGPLRLVSTLRGNAYKGIETVAACAALLAERLEQGIEWALVGIRAGEEIQRIVERKLGLAFERSGLQPVGRRPAEEVVGRLIDGDIYVLPSRIENSPNGLCEAMIVGMPVVATEVGGVPSLLEDGEQGLLVPAGDPQAMSEAILRLVREPALGDRLGAAARRRALERHDPGRVAAKQLEIYRQVMAVAGRDGPG